MAWITITEAHIKTRISGAELAAFRAVALASGQSDPITDVISATTNLVRGYVAACQRNTLGADGTIPDKLLQPALSLLIMDIMSRAGGKVIDPNGQRKEAADKATQLMRDVAHCNFAIDLPTVESTENIGAYSPTYSARDRRFRDQDGI